MTLRASLYYSGCPDPQTRTRAARFGARSSGLGVQARSAALWPVELQLYRVPKSVGRAPWIGTMQQNLKEVRWCSVSSMSRSGGWIRLQRNIIDTYIHSRRSAIRRQEGGPRSCGIALEETPYSDVFCDSTKRESSKRKTPFRYPRPRGVPGQISRRNGKRQSGAFDLGGIAADLGMVVGSTPRSTVSESQSTRTLI